MFVPDNVPGHRPFQHIRTLMAGWLPADGTHQQGQVPDDFKRRLSEFLGTHGTTVALTRGFHTCQLCPDTVPVKPKSSSELWLFAAVDGEVVIYQMPRMIGHYVLAHGYRPPQPIIDAVLAGEACLITEADVRARFTRLPTLASLTPTLAVPAARPASSLEEPAAAHGDQPELNLAAHGVRYLLIGDATDAAAIFAGTPEDFDAGLPNPTPEKVLEWAMREGLRVTFLPTAPALI